MQTVVLQMNMTLNKNKNYHSLRSFGRANSARPFYGRYMHFFRSIFVILIATFSSYLFAEESIYCGVDEDDLDGIALAWLGFHDLKKQGLIFDGEAFVWEYSTDKYCGSDEYEVSAENQFESEEEFNSTFRGIGISDVCQFRVAKKIQEPPLKFLTGFERRLYTIEENSELVTWFIIKNKSAIKFYPDRDHHECIKYGI